MPYVFGFNILALVFCFHCYSLSGRPAGEGERARPMRAGILGAGAHVEDLFSLCGIEHSRAARTAKVSPGGRKPEKTYGVALAAGVAIIPVRGLPADLDEVAREGYPVGALDFIEQHGCEKSIQ